MIQITYFMLLVMHQCQSPSVNHPEYSNYLFFNVIVLLEVLLAIIIPM